MPLPGVGPDLPELWTLPDADAVVLRGAAQGRAQSFGAGFKGPQPWNPAPSKSLKWYLRFMVQWFVPDC